MQFQYLAFAVLALAVGVFALALFRGAQASSLRVTYRKGRDIRVVSFDEPTDQLFSEILQIIRDVEESNEAVWARSSTSDVARTVNDAKIYQGTEVSATSGSDDDDTAQTPG